MTKDTITIRLRRPKLEVEATTKPNANAWGNKLTEQALGPQCVDWNEHFNWKSMQRHFGYRASEMRRGERR